MFVGCGVAIFKKHSLRFAEILVLNEYDNVEMRAVDIITDDRHELIDVLRLQAAQLN